MKARSFFSLLLCLLLVVSLALPVFAEDGENSGSDISVVDEGGENEGSGGGTPPEEVTPEEGGTPGEEEKPGEEETPGEEEKPGEEETPGDTGEGDETGATEGSGAGGHQHTWVLVAVQQNATCETEGSRRVRCVSCGETATQVIGKRNHTYDNACDPDCNVCHAIRQVTHTPKKEWSNDASGHWHVCSVCGSKIDEAAHSPGPEATMERDQTCLTCGYVIKKALDHTHQFETKFSSDETGHWYGCEKCSEQKDFEEHVYDNACDPDCNICGYLRKDAHSYKNSYQQDEKNHWRVCSICGEEEKHAAHVPGDPATEEQAQSCKVCGRELVPALTHVHLAEEWTYDEHTHQGICACGQEMEQGPHAWGTGAENPDGTRTITCMQCGAEKPEEAAGGAEAGDSGRLVVGIAAAVCAVGAAAALAVVLIKQSRYTG